MLKISQIFLRKSLKIIITDSGLGGLSIQASIDKKLRTKGNKKINLIYFNSFAGGNLGYNSLKNKNDKLYVFESALNGMMNLNPDIILIACNTLSVLYHETEISKKIEIPVIGIVESGIEMIIDKINTVSDFDILILGTETTINSNAHKINLINSGIDESRIINQFCENLESEIQINPNSKNVHTLISKYLGDSLKKIQNPKTHIFVLLACTHYAYSKNIFEEKLFEMMGNNFSVINPNEKMSEIFDGISSDTFQSENNVENRILTRVKLKEDQIKILSKLLVKDSPDLVETLQKSEHIPDLFKFDEKMLEYTN